MAKERKSLFNVITDNVAEAGRSCFLHRVFCIGDHNMGNKTAAIMEIFDESVKMCNAEFHDDNLTGLFLYYNASFVYMLEGNEYSVYKHFSHILRINSEKKFMDRGKIILVFHHITQRFYNRWIGVTARPPTLLTKLSPNCEIEEVGRNVFACIRKIYKLAGYFRKTIENSSSVREAVATVTEKCSSCLPEAALVEFLLTHPAMTDLTRYVNFYQVTETIRAYEDLVWPVPCDFVPYNVFDRDTIEE